MNRSNQSCFAWIVPVVLIAVGVAEADENYRGRALHQWLNDLAAEDAAAREQANSAIRAIGTNGLPRYLDILRYTNSTWDIARAADAIALLGPTAKPALPALAELLNHAPGRDDRSIDVAMAFRGFGVDAVAPLTNLLASSNPRVRSLACGAIAQLGPAASGAIPPLLKCLRDQDRPVRLNAALALGEIHQEPAIVVPALVKILREEHRRREESFRGFIAYALSNFGTTAKVAIPLLLEVAKSGKDGSAMAISAVLAIDPEAAVRAGINTNSTAAASSTSNRP